MLKRIKKSLGVLLGGAVLLSTGAAAPISSDAAAAIPAFPGAVGGGMYATGGRGGEVYHVTNLNDSGAGSFRDAVSKSGRIVVFDVSGTIELKSNIIVQSNITIAGQTAPGGSGITLKNYKLGMGGDNIICRFISSRPGPYASTSSGNDAWGGAKGSNSMIDHCSMGWTTDEQWALYSNNEYYTVQYSVIGPADSWGGHSKGIHGFGIMMGKGYCTFDHNLIVHNVSRNFRGKVVGTETADFTNNVIYNWAYQTAYGTIGHLNYVNNTLKMGNGTTGGKHYVSVDSSTNPQNFSIYCAGNRMLNKDGSVYGDVTYDNWNGITVKDGLGITKDSVKSNSPFNTTVGGVNVSTATTCESAESSYENVLTYAGNGISSDTRTAIDMQSANETRTGTGNMSGTAAYADATTDEKAKLDSYNIQCEVKYEYPSAILQKTITDADNDGMDDYWELARGLNPNDPTDTNGDYCGQGYTNIEYYLNDLTVDAFPEGVVTPSPSGSVDIPTISAFDKIEAESFSDQSGVRAEDCAEGGQNVGYIENGDYIMFKRVDFGDGAKSFNARIASALSGGNIELYLDKMNGTPAAVCKAAGTGNWQEYTDITGNVGNITGVHDLYLKFTGGEGFLLNINYFSFGKEAVPVNGRLIKNLLVFDSDNASDWVITDGAAVGSAIFGDREFTFTSLPAELEGSEILRTACDSKAFADTAAEFTAGEDIVVYAAVDSRLTNIPQWLSVWENTGMTAASSNDVTFNIYSKSFKSGEKVVLGSNGQSSYCVNYAVLVKEDKGTEPTEPTEPETIPGDVNSDDAFSVMDLVAMQKYILNIGDLDDPMAGDVCKDGKLNVFDLCVMKQMISEK